MKLLTKKPKKVEESWKDQYDDFSEVRNAIAPSIIKEELDYVRLGENFTRTLVVVNFPNVVKAGWLSKLYRFKGNLSISIHCVPKASDKIIESISKSIMEYESRLENTVNPRRLQDTMQKLESSKRMLQNLMEGDNNSIYHVHMYLHLQANKIEELDRETKRLQNILFKSGLNSHIPYGNMYKAFESCLPIVDNKLPEMTYRNMDCSALSSFFPFDESEIFESSGFIKGFNVTTGSLVLINQYHLNSHNEFVLGKTGAGKSFYMKVDMLRHFMSGVRIFIIDPEREYKNIVKKIGGQHITISSMSGTIINPLEVLHPNIDKLDLNNDVDDDETESVALLHQKIVRLKVFFKLIKRDLSPLESALIEDALYETYLKKNITWDTDFSNFKSTDFPILEDLYEEIKAKVGNGETELKNFLAILKTYVTGSNARMFNGYTNVNLNNDVICFDLKGLEDEGESQSAAMFNVLSFLWDEISRDDKTFKRLYVDEAHILADPDNPRSMRFLFNIYKRIRKYKGGATAATQQISDYLSAVEGKRNYGKSVIGNSISKFILGLEPSDIQDLRDYNVLKLSEEEERILSSDKKGEGIFIAEKNRVHMRVEATPEELRLIDPKQYKEKYAG
jgi:type IV secretory pathway VirB4 component